MGLLDEAIREHLELKRLRGADPAEVAALEREALGPPRRGDELLDDFGEKPPTYVETTQAVEESHSTPEAYPETGYGLPETVAAEPLVPETPPLEEPLPLEEEPPPTSEYDVASEIAREREAEAPPIEAEPAHEPEPAHEDEPEDVLEETPEFLQETPEHERLWFEQRPPRDFDFDK